MYALLVVFSFVQIKIRQGAVFPPTSTLLQLPPRIRNLALHKLEDLGARAFERDSVQAKDKNAQSLPIFELMGRLFVVIGRP
jgi:hypothetical protein